MITEDGTSTIKVVSQSDGSFVRATDSSSGVECSMGSSRTTLTFGDFVFSFPSAKAKSVADILNATESERAARIAATT